MRAGSYESNVTAADNTPFPKIPAKIRKAIPRGLVLFYENNQSSWHLFCINWEYQKFKVSRNKVLRYLMKNNIYSTIHYKPIHHHPYYQSLGFKKGQFKNSVKHYETALSLPIHPGLSEQEQNKVIDLIKEIATK